MHYDDYGNMIWKSDIGTMDYGHSSKPHAVKTIDPVSGYFPSNHILDYYPSGMTKSIRETIGSVDVERIRFYYGPDRQRRKTEFFNYNIATQTTELQSTKYFAFGNYEETVNAVSGDITKYLYIASPDGITAMRKTINGNTNMYYALTDYLGSIDAVVPAVNGVVPVVEYYLLPIVATQVMK